MCRTGVVWSGRTNGESASLGTAVAHPRRRYTVGAHEKTVPPEDSFARSSHLPMDFVSQGPSAINAMGVLWLLPPIEALIVIVIDVPLASMLTTVYTARTIGSPTPGNGCIPLVSTPWSK